MRPHGKNQQTAVLTDGGRSGRTTSMAATVPSGGEQQTAATLEPRDFFLNVALLISEARLADKNAGNGRRDGPHCPDTSRMFAAKIVAAADTAEKADDSSPTAVLSHVCDYSQIHCRQARHLTEEAINLWSRNIPVCLYLLILPDQCVNSTECLSSHAVLLERWTIQVLPKRNTDNKLLPGQFLLQAIRSYLHFSQLSAWLIESRGKSPTNVIYKIGMPGETDGAKWNTNNATNSSNYEKHQFPICHLGKLLILNVFVESLPRSFDLHTTLCRCCSPPPQSSFIGDNTVSDNVQNETSDIDSSLSVHQQQTSSRQCESESEYVSRFCLSTNSELMLNDSSATASSATSSTTDFEDESLVTMATTKEYVVIAPSSINLPPGGTTSNCRPNRATTANTSCSATNRLFDINNQSASPRDDVIGDETSLKQRIDALRLEAQQLTSKWRRYSAANRDSGAAYVRTPDVRFFVADDDDVDDVIAEARTPTTIDAPSTSHAAAPTQRSCRKILFSGDVDLFHDVDENASLIDFATVVECRQKQQDADAADAADAERRRSAGVGAVKRKESLNDKVGAGSRRQNESSLFSKKGTKKLPHSAAVLQFNRRTGLPLSSSPAPLKRNQNSFNFDSSITSVTAIKSAFYTADHESGSSDSDSGLPLCKSAPASTNLLGNFEESALNGRIKPFGSVEGFTLELGASGAFCPSHVTLPVTTLFFTVSEDNAPSPYFGHCTLESVGRKGYHTPKKGTVQATLFNPQGTVVKMFVVRYDLSDMPVGCQTFVRQRTFFMPSSASLDDALHNRSWLRYLIHLRFATSRSGKLYLHTDIRMLFSRKSELDAYNIEYAGNGVSVSNCETYELRSFTEMPKNPKFSPRKLATRCSDRDVNNVSREILV